MGEGSSVYIVISTGMGVPRLLWRGSLTQQYHFIKLVDMAIELFHNVCEDGEWVEIMVEQGLLQFLPSYFLEDQFADMSKIEEYPHDLPEAIQEWLEDRRSDSSGARAPYVMSGVLGPTYHFMKVVHEAIRTFHRLGDVEERVEMMMKHDLLRFLPQHFLLNESEEEFEEYRGILPSNIQEWLEKRQNERSPKQ